MSRSRASRSQPLSSAIAAMMQSTVEDGVVAALAERLRIYRILTIDHEDFGPLRIGERFSQKLVIVP